MTARRERPLKRGKIFRRKTSRRASLFGGAVLDARARRPH